MIHDFYIILSMLKINKQYSLRLLKLVNTLVDFSSIEAERIQAVYEPTDLATLTIELASMFRSSIERAGIQLIIDCPPLPEPIYIDREVWEKIVMNLFSNALKFTFKGEIILSLRWVTNGIELEVQDTGITTATYLDEVKSWSAETNVVVQVQQMPPPNYPFPRYC